MITILGSPDNIDHSKQKAKSIIILVGCCVSIIEWIDMAKDHNIGTNRQLILHDQELEDLPANGQTRYKARLLQNLLRLGLELQQQ